MHIRGAARAGVVALVVAGGLALAGCTGDDPAPKPTTASPQPTSSTSEPTTSEPAVAVPELPEAATQNTTEGAAAFAAHWGELLNYAYATGDVAPVRAATHPECEECFGLIDEIEAEARRGYSYEGGQVVFDNLVGGLVSSDGMSIVSGSYTQAASVTRDSTGTVVDQSAAAPTRPFAFYCQWTDGWQMRRTVAVS